MPQDSSEKITFSSLPYGLAAIAVVLFGGLAYWSGTLTTLRPSLSGTGLPAETARGKVNARLWQDPLAAVHKYAGEHRDDPGYPPEVTKAGNGTLVLLVTLPGGSTFNDRETRLRSRYAVLAALDAASYHPDDEERISYWRRSRTRPAGCSETRGYAADPEPLVFAHESFTANDHPLPKCSYDRVTVLWADDDALWSNCLAGFQDLAAGLNVQLGSELKVLGPAWSGSLRTLINNKDVLPQPAHDAPDGPASPTFRPAIFSPWATADDGSVNFGPLSTNLIERTIATDDKLAEKLLGELRLRIRGLSQDRMNRIALVSEWDTLYGQTLPQTFAKALSGGEQQPILVRYLKGLDGKILGEEPGSGSAKSAANTAKQMDADASAERPEGQSQLDYARRLPGELKRLQGKGRIAAIGVLGSDVYDKLLLFQALRPEFPDAVFFTTDLDARLLEVDQLKWTRNVIVASSYGLTLEQKAGDERMDSVRAPFRDNYQTAVYATTRRILEPSFNYKEGLEPKLFEIGRTNAHQLDDGTSRTTTGGVLPWFLGLPLAAASLIAICFMLIQLRREHPQPAAFRWRSLLVCAVWLLPVAGMIVAARASREPFSLTEGVSIWPSEFLRLAAALLSIYYLRRATQRIRHNASQISARFDLKSIKKPNLPAIPFWWDCWCLLTEDWLSKNQSLDIPALWQRYQVCDASFPRWRRVTGLAMVYSIFGLALMLTLGVPTVPYRGNPAYYTDRIALVCGVTLFVLLTFYVLDATVLCERFIRQAVRKLSAESEIVWPDGLYLRWGSTSGDPHFPAVWHLIELVAVRTRVVGGLVLYPFVVLVLILIARSSFFDHWNWPPSLIALWGVNSLLVILGGLLLRRAAEDVRQAAAQRLRRERILARSQQDDSRINQLDLSIAEIERESRGAFASFAEQPVFRALLLPFGGYGAAVYLDQFARLF